VIVRARAPLRLGLAGGGTDVSPFCEIYGGNVLNATIDVYAYCTLGPSQSGRIRFIAADRGEKFEAELTDKIPPCGTLALHKGVYNRVVRDFNNGEPIPLTVTTYSDVPAGSGLGSSSTLVVVILKAFVELLNIPLGEYEIAHLAYEIERIDLGAAGGKQDQYAATFGGFNFIEFYAKDRVVVNPLRIKNWIVSELESSLVLFYTGVSRVSADIIDQQSMNIAQSDNNAIAAMKELKEDAIIMKESLLKGDLERFADYIGKSWQAKKRTANAISNDQIDETYQAALAAGARAGKLSGAGGGGFMMFLVEPTRRIDVVRALETRPGRVFNCHFVKTGTEGWRIIEKGEC